MCELPVYSTTCCAHECTETGANILWSQAVAIDTSFILGELEKTPYNSLVFLIFLDPVGHSPDVTGTQIQESIAQPPQQTTMPTMPKRGRRRERETEREEEDEEGDRASSEASVHASSARGICRARARERKREGGERERWQQGLVESPAQSFALALCLSQPKSLPFSFLPLRNARERKKR